jgi:hypothetical protein
LRGSKNLLIEEEENDEDNNPIELLCVDAGIREGVLHTGELHILKYKLSIIGNNQEHWTTLYMKKINK